MGASILFILADSALVLSASIFQLLLAWLTISITKSGLYLGLIMSLAFGIRILFQPYCGYLVDHYHKGRLFLSAAVIFSLNIMLFTGNLLFLHYNLLITAILVVVIEVTATIAGSSSSIMISLLAPSSVRTRLIGYMASLQSTQIIIGAIIGGSSIALIGIHFTLIIITIMSFIAVLLAWIFRHNKALSLSDKSTQNAWNKITQGFKILKQLPPEYISCIAGVIDNLILPAFFMVILPVYIKLVLNLPATWLAAMEISYAIGMMLSGLAIPKLLDKGISRYQCIITANATMAVFFILFPFANLSIQLVMMLINGFALGANNIPTSTMRALAVPAKYRGRLSAAVIFSCSLLIPVGNAGFGILTNANYLPYLDSTMIIIGILMFIPVIILLRSRESKDAYSISDHQLENYYASKYQKAFTNN
ncbi:MAG: MFS transporter [Francisellaceae bacterium]